MVTYKSKKSKFDYLDDSSYVDEDYENGLIYNFFIIY